MIKRSEHPKKLRGQRNQCPSCLEYFNTNSAFTQHRAGDHALQTRHCLSVEQIAAKGWTLNQDGFWVRPVSENGKEWLAKMRNQKNLSGKPPGNAI